MLRLLPDRSHSQVIVIEESKNIESMKVEEFVGSLMTYELHLHKGKKGDLELPLKPRMLRMKKMKVMNIYGHAHQTNLEILK